MAEKPLPFPPDTPVRDFKTPNYADAYYFEHISKDSPLYTPLARGTPYSTITNAQQAIITQFPNLWFLKEIASSKDKNLAIRIWATDPLAENTYNAAVTYLAESTSNPIFARIFTVRRDAYDASSPGTLGSTLTSLLAIKVTNAGTSPYKSPVVTIGGSGGAAAQAVLNSGGLILEIPLTNQGSGYNPSSLPAITITDSNGGTGAGATATAIMQPVGTVLTSQQKREFPEDDPRRDEYVQVIQVFTTLPGPWLYDMAFDPQTLNFVITKRRQNIAANINEYCSSEQGGGATLSLTTSGGKVTAGSISGTYTGYYADFFPVFINPPSTGVAAMGYGTAVNGAPTGTLYITQPGSGYGGSTSGSIPGLTTVESKRQDIDSYIGWEIITYTGAGGGWYDVESRGERYPEIYSDFVYINVLGSTTFFIPARSRTILGISLYWFSNGPLYAPANITALPNGATVLNPTLIWNPVLCAWKMFFDFSMADCLSDGGTYAGDYSNGSIFESFSETIPASDPTASQYAGYVAAGDWVTAEFQSKRFMGNSYLNKQFFMPLL